MFILDLNRLDRSGAIEVTGEIAPVSERELGGESGDETGRAIAVNKALWTEIGARSDGPIHVHLRASATATGQVMVRGEMSGAFVHDCRRCLEPVRRRFREEIALVWSTPDDLDAGAEVDGDDASDEGGVRLLDPMAKELDLTGALREELVLRMPRWVTCREDCAGLCPRCGINRNEETCACTAEESDPRWDALRILANDERK